MNVLRGVLTPWPVTLHFHKQERRTPAHQYQPGQAFNASQKTQVACRLNVDVAYGGKCAERKVHAVQKGAVKVTNQQPPAQGMVHSKVRYGKN